MLLKIQVPRTGLNDEIVLTSFPITIGRAPDNTLVLEDSWVSRHHLRIEQAAGKLALTDLGAANGVYLNGRLVQPRTPVTFTWSDRIGIGEFQFWFEPGGFQAPSTLDHWTVSLLPPPGLLVAMGDQIFRYPFEQPVISIGRTPDSTVIIDHPMVSRRHAEIHLESGKYVLYDVGSTNGISFQGERITQHSLIDGDLLNIPGTDIRIEFRAHIGYLTADRPLRKELTLFRPKAAAALGLLNLKGMEVITIGRAENNRLVLSHPQVELYHATVERSGSRYRVRDLNSLSGVFVNGKRIINEAWLHINDEIRVVGFRLALHESGLERLADEDLRFEAVGLKESSGKHRIAGVSLCFGPDELVAVVGGNGQLRTALIEALGAVRAPSAGRVAVNGSDLYQNNELDRRNIGYVPRAEIVHPELSVFSALDFAAQLRMLPDFNPEERKRRVQEVLSDLDLTEQAGRQINELANQQARLVSLGVELLTQPRLLFLDEPTSGMDAAGSAGVMRLLRKLTDQGRSVVLTAPASHQIMMCDKVAVLTPGGTLAYYGPPEEGLAYFDAYRAEEDGQKNPLDFKQIQAMLGRPNSGSAEDWQQRYLQSQPYQDYIAGRIRASEPQKKISRVESLKNVRPPTGFWRQFSVLTRRNFQLIRQDKLFLGLMLALGPLIGALNFIWGGNLFDVQAGSPSRVITAMFMAAFTSVLIGIGLSIREIVREADIYKRERAVEIHLFPYVISKLTTGLVICLYQSLALTVFLYMFVLRGSPMAAVDYALFFVTIFLCVMSGYLIGLLISAVVSNQNWAYPLVIAVLLLQYIFSGAFLPLNRIPGGALISLSDTTHWGFEALVNISSIGRGLVGDACWQRVFTSGERASRFTETEKDQLNCSCMGPDLFTQCQFPGIRSAQIFPPAAQQVLAATAPPEPVQPTTIFTPTAISTPTLLRTFTPYPTPTSIATPIPPVTATSNPLQTELPPTSDPGFLLTYTAQRLEQERSIQATLTAQQQGYENQLNAQKKMAQDLLNNQKAEYDKLYQDQLRQYASDLSQYAQALEQWQGSRLNAVANAENSLQVVVDNYGESFQGNVFTRWLGMGGIMVVLFSLLILVLKSKDPR